MGLGLFIMDANRKQSALELSGRAGKLSLVT
jgi:hypothetical protein